jgi:hypothetical protein
MNCLDFQTHLTVFWCTCPYVGRCVVLLYMIEIVCWVGERQTYLGVSCLQAEGSFCYAPIGLNNSVSSCQMLCSLCISCAGGCDMLKVCCYLLSAVCAVNYCVTVTARWGLALGDNTKILSTQHILSNPGLPLCLRHCSVAVRLLGLFVRIPSGAWISVDCSHVETFTKGRSLI